MRLVEVDHPALRAEVEVHLQRLIVRPRDLHARWKTIDSGGAERLARLPGLQVRLVVPLARQLVADGVQRDAGVVADDRRDEAPLPVFVTTDAHVPV